MNYDVTYIKQGIPCSHDDCIKHAKAVTMWNSNAYSVEILCAANNSIIQKPMVSSANFQQILSDIQSRNQVNTDIVVVDRDTISALFTEQHSRPNKCIVLNFASFKHPGGGFMSGSVAQEESLCHSSTLYNILQRLQLAYYDQNNTYFEKSKRDYFYNNRFIYTPGVRFYSNKSSSDIFADVITLAAPNKKAKVDTNASLDRYGAILMERLDTIFYAAILGSNIQVSDVTLILGAFGCGLYGNDPTDVAKCFKSLLDDKYKGIFNRVVFAIPIKHSRNYSAFKTIF